MKKIISRKKTGKKEFWKVAVAIIITLAFVMPMADFSSARATLDKSVFDDKKIEGPVIEIELTQDVYSGHLTAVIKNVGDADATNVNWSIIFDGNFDFFFFGERTTGRVFVIPPGENVTVSSGSIIGFGITILTISAECAEGSSDTKTWKAFVWLLFIKIL